MKITALFFASYREKTGTSSTEIDLPDGSTTKDLINHLGYKYRSLPTWDGIMIAVNSEYATSETLLHDADQVALIPPVSGG